MHEIFFRWVGNTQRYVALWCVTTTFATLVYNHPGWAHSTAAVEPSIWRRKEHLVRQEIAVCVFLLWQRVSKRRRPGPFRRRLACTCVQFAALKSSFDYHTRNAMVPAPMNMASICNDIGSWRCTIIQGLFLDAEGTMAYMCTVYPSATEGPLVTTMARQRSYACFFFLWPAPPICHKTDAT